MEFAKGRFFWANKETDGASTEEHVEVARKNAFASMVLADNTFDEAPEETSCPYEVQYIWTWYLQLDSTRQNGGMGFTPISHLEITAWSEGMQLNVIPFERTALRAIDEAYRIHCNSKDKKHG